MSRLTLLFWLGFVAWCVTLFILSSIPGNRVVPLPFPQADKVVHSGIFFVGSCFLSVAFLRTFGRSFLKWSIPVFAIMVLIGMGDEFHQLYTPGRSGNDRGDLAADAVGALIGITFVALLHGYRPAKTNSPAPGSNRAA